MTAIVMGEEERKTQVRTHAGQKDAIKTQVPEVARWRSAQSEGIRHGAKSAACASGKQWAAAALSPEV